MYRGTYIPLGRDGPWEAQEWLGFTLLDRRALLRGSEAWGAGVCKNEADGGAVAAEAPWKVAPAAGIYRAPGAAVSAKAPVSSVRSSTWECWQRQTETCRGVVCVSVNCASRGERGYRKVKIFPIFFLCFLNISLFFCVIPSCYESYLDFKQNRFACFLIFG